MTRTWNQPRPPSTHPATDPLTAAKAVRCSRHYAEVGAIAETTIGALAPSSFVAAPPELGRNP